MLQTDSKFIRANICYSISSSECTGFLHNGSRTSFKLLWDGLCIRLLRDEMEVMTDGITPRREYHRQSGFAPIESSCKRELDVNERSNRDTDLRVKGEVFCERVLRDWGRNESQVTTISTNKFVNIWKLRLLVHVSIYYAWTNRDRAGFDEDILFV